MNSDMSKNDKSNVAYTAEYEEFLKERDYVFETAPHSENNFVLGDDEYFVTEYLYDINKIMENGVMEHTGTSKAVVRNKANEVILEIKSNYDNQFYSLVKHKNGKDYLVYRKDLYGYSVFDIVEKKNMDYIPKAILDGVETFIWCDVEYCSANNLLAVFGCYWAHPYTFMFFDFTNPMGVPFHLCCDGYDFDYQIEDVSFTDKGECIFTIMNYETEKKSKK